jgi:hypothetical protein
MAVSFDGKMLAMGCNNEVKIFHVSFSDSGIPSLTRLYSIKPAMGTNTAGLAFDRAGNVYVISNSSERLGVWSLPKVENTFTTPAPSSEKLDVISEVPQVEASEKSGISVSQSGERLRDSGQQNRKIANNCRLRYQRKTDTLDKCFRNAGSPLAGRKDSGIVYSSSTYRRKRNSFRFIKQ